MKAKDPKVPIVPICAEVLKVLGKTPVIDIGKHKAFGGYLLKERTGTRKTSKVRFFPPSEFAPKKDGPPTGFFSMTRKSITPQNGTMDMENGNK